LELRHTPRTSHYLGTYDDIDVTLDTFPCTGGVTTCESLWMGVPVLSLCGSRPAGRNSASILARVGLADWAVATAEEYVAMAKGLEQSLDHLAALRAGLRSRMAVSLCDGVRFTRTLEEAYRKMWQHWCSRRAGQE
jgi:predicted O-linked N-acetylglucosamine transferase (SPINDLY family)